MQEIFSVLFVEITWGKKRWTCRELPNVLLIDGESEAFDSARNLNGFDEKKYYQSLGISQIIQVESLKPSKQKQLTLSGLRQQLIWRIDQQYSKRLASYIKG